MIEIRRETSTLGSMSLEKDPRVVAVLKDGKKIVADVARMCHANFRAYLQRLLKKDLTDESREQILMALQSPKTDAELAFENKLVIK